MKLKQTENANEHMYDDLGHAVIEEFDTCENRGEKSATAPPSHSRDCLECAPPSLRLSAVNAPMSVYPAVFDRSLHAINVTMPWGIGGRERRAVTAASPWHCTRGIQLQGNLGPMIATGREPEHRIPKTPGLLNFTEPGELGVLPGTTAAGAA